METKIKTLLNELLCFKAEEIQRYSEGLKLMPKQAQEKFLKILQGAKKDQDALMAKAAKKELNFAKNLDTFLTDETKKIKSDFEEKEHSQADKILDEL